MIDKEKGPSKEEFDTCAEVLSWLITWYGENEPDAVEIGILQAAEIEIPESMENFLEDDDE